MGRAIKFYDKEDDICFVTLIVEFKELSFIINVFIQYANTYSPLSHCYCNTLKIEVHLSTLKKAAVTVWLWIGRYIFDNKKGPPTPSVKN